MQIFGAIGLVFFYIIGRRWFGIWPAIAATALLAVNPIYHQYHNELIIAAPSLVAFIIFLERIQYLTRFPQRWWAWLSLAAVWALVLTMYGPSRIFSAIVILVWLAWAVVRAVQRQFPLSGAQLLARASTLAISTIVFLVVASPGNLKRLGPGIFFPGSSETTFVVDSVGDLWQVLKTNGQIIAESLLTGGGSFHSSFVEATLIQGRYPTIPLIVMPLMVIGLIIALVVGWRQRRDPANKYVAVILLALITAIPMLTASIVGSPFGPDPTLVNHRLVFFLVPAYLAISVLAATSLNFGRTWVVLAGVVTVALFAQGSIAIISGHANFESRAAGTDPALTDPAGQLQWLDGYSLNGKGVPQGSHFQQHEQYDRWASEVAEEVSKGSDGQVVIVPTAITCFPEAPFETHTLGELSGKNYHPVFLSLYLASHLAGAKMAYVNVPPKDLAPGYVMFESGLFPGPIMLGPDGTYDYESAEPAGSKLMEYGSGDLSVVVTTTPLELETAERLLAATGKSYRILDGLRPCWGDSSFPPK
ncbi:MAG: hypothetical protein JW384_03956 [Nitrosomonadaceae bacterium]|nr:hypothetical protein [Nitrosomonadaceae bacterium]